ncbi:MAG: DUF3696 domain-containing protein [Anaerolineales bacterium]|nr:DUF3696 domain-containing protein [Anaerolineales bacterium]
MTPREFIDLLREQLVKCRHEHGNRFLCNNYGEAIMITRLHLQNFKSWKDTERMRMAPLTGLFGANSSGKTSLLQFLLMLKQTAESADRSRVLHTGDDRSYVDLGTFHDLIYGHDQAKDLAYSLEWTLTTPLHITDPERKNVRLFQINKLQFEAVLRNINGVTQVDRFTYQFDGNQFGMARQIADGNTDDYELTVSGYELKRSRGRKWPLPRPVRNYGFPDQVNAYYQNAGFLSELVLSLEQQLQELFYLGPLREYPNRHYLWAGERPPDVGSRGEQAVPALLASRRFGKVIHRGRGRPKQTVEECVAMWLKRLGLIHSFGLKPIAENRKEYEVRVRRTAISPEVLITDVGFGVSQILPVLVLCFYAPKGATLILEQPEIHLHPAVQAGLADVFIDAIKTRDIQIVLESHSEHLLRRLQLRIAEEKLLPEQTALYFTRISDKGQSSLQELDVDSYGNIRNWPVNFFGDELGELAAMTEAALQRQMELT